MGRRPEPKSVEFSDFTGLGKEIFSILCLKRLKRLIHLLGARPFVEAGRGVDGYKGVSTGKGGRFYGGGSAASRRAATSWCP